MNCSSCGVSLPDGAKFCGICGATQAAPAPAPGPAPAEPVVPVAPAAPTWQEPPAYQEPIYQAPAQPAYQPVPAPLPIYQEPMPMYQPPAQPAYQPAAEPAPPKGSRYAPISALGYFGYFLIFGIPLLGLILSIVWAGDKTGSVNRQNLAKLMLVFKILGIVMLVISGIFTGIFWAQILEMANQITSGGITF